MDTGVQTGVASGGGGHHRGGAQVHTQAVPRALVHQALSKVSWGRGWRRAEPRTRTCIIGTEVWYLDDEVALRVSGHFGELADQFAELGAAVRIYHPAWRREAGMGPLRAPTITPRTASLGEKLMPPPPLPSKCCGNLLPWRTFQSRHISADVAKSDMCVHCVPDNTHA